LCVYWWTYSALVSYILDIDCGYKADISYMDIPGSFTLYIPTKRSHNFDYVVDFHT